jgi:hypothetical protein
MEGHNSNSNNTELNNIYIGGDELVFDKNGQLGGGFSVNSIMMKAGMSPIMTINSQSGGAGDANKVSDLFNHLAVPSWVTNFPMKGYEYKEKINKKNDDSDSDVEEDLHDKLLAIVKESDDKLHDSNNKKTNKKKSRRPLKEVKKNISKKNKKLKN